MTNFSSTGRSGSVAGGRLNAARSFQLAHLVDKYLPLKDNERERFEEQISEDENKEVEGMNMAWAEKLYTDGRNEGEEIGHQRGQLEGSRRMLLRQLQLRFGELPESALQRIESCSDPEKLEGWSDGVVTAPDLASMGLD